MCCSKRPARALVDREYRPQEKFFGAILAVVVTQVIENKFGKNDEPIFISFALHNLDLHSGAIDEVYL